jgi:hypothetical protein
VNAKNSPLGAAFQADGDLVIGGDDLAGCFVESALDGIGGGGMLAGQAGAQRGEQGDRPESPTRKSALGLVRQTEDEASRIMRITPGAMVILYIRPIPKHSMTLAAEAPIRLQSRRLTQVKRQYEI